MPEYIDKKAVYAVACKGCTMSGNEYGECYCPEPGCERLTLAFVSAPAADVVAVKHGRWIGLEYDGYADGCPVYDLWECSECGEEVSGEDVPITHPYCHGCGAKMDGGKLNDH